MPLSRRVPSFWPLPRGIPDGFEGVLLFAKPRAGANQPLGSLGSVASDARILGLVDLSLIVVVVVDLASRLGRRSAVGLFLLSSSPISRE
jgi:hypothetical protein